MIECLEIYLGIGVLLSGVLAGSAVMMNREPALKKLIVFSIFWLPMVIGSLFS